VYTTKRTLSKLVKLFSQHRRLLNTNTMATLMHQGSLYKNYSNQDIHTP